MAGYLRYTIKIPFDGVRKILGGLWGLDLTPAALVGFDKQVDPDNNRAERALRPSVVMRKITYENNSATGVFNHETLMSLVETAKLRGINPLDLMMSLAGGDDPAKIKTMLFAPTTS